jgi:hypothetical protein
MAEPTNASAVTNSQFSYEEPGAQAQSAPSSQPTQQAQQFSYEEPGAQTQSAPDVQKFLSEAADNFGAGALRTVEGLGELGHKAIHAGLPHSMAEVLSPDVGMNAEKKVFEPYTALSGSTASKVAGYGGESLMELITGDEALKGLSLADKLSKSAKIAEALEGSPRLMQMLKLGANIGKAQSELGPEERALIAKYPMVARLVGLGMDSLRFGAAQSAQTTAHTGGDVKEGLKEGAEGAAGNAVFGAPFAAVGGALAKAGEAKTKLDKMTEAGANAPDKSDAVKAVRGWIDDEEQKMHNEFEAGVSNMKDDLQGETIKPEDSALAKKAQELLQTTPGEGPKLARELASELRGIVPGTERTENLLESLAKPVREEETTMTPREYLKTVGATSKTVQSSDADKEVVAKLREAIKNGDEIPMSSVTKDAEGNILEADGRHRAVAADLEGKATIPVKTTTRMSDYDIDGLVDLRQKLGAKARELPYGDPNARRLRQLQSAVDDDIQTMAENADKPEVAQQYQNLRSTYRTKLADLESAPIEKLRTDEPGKELNDVGQYVLSGNTSKAKIDTLRRVIGPDRFDTVADSIATNWVHDATNESGRFDPQKFLSQYSKVKPEIRDSLFGGRPAVKLNDFVNDATSARLVQQAVKAGILTIGGGTLGGGAGALLGLLIGAGDTKASQIAGRGLLDYLVGHPATWAVLRGGEKVASSKAAQTATKVAARAAVAGISPSLKSVYASAAPALGGSQ